MGTGFNSVEMKAFVFEFYNPSQATFVYEQQSKSAAAFLLAGGAQQKHAVHIKDIFAYFLL